MQECEVQYMARPDVKIFQLLTDEVCCDLLHQLLTGDDLQTQQQLATALDLNSSTVSRKMAVLEGEGVVERIGPRKAPYRVIFPSKTRELLQAGADLAQLSLESRTEWARSHAGGLRKDGMAGGNLRDRAKEGA